MHRRVSNALTLLACVAESGTPRTVSDLAEQTRLSTSTASRIAAELAAGGMLTRGDRTGTYTPGGRTLVLAGAAAPYLIDVQVALGRLSSITGETACLVAETVPTAGDPPYRVAAAAPAAWSLTATAELGTTLPDRSGALCAAFAAARPIGSARVHRGVTPAGITDRAIPVWGDGERPFGALLVRVPHFRDPNHGLVEHVLQTERARLEQRLEDDRRVHGVAPSGAVRRQDAETPSLELCLRLLEAVARRPGTTLRDLAAAVGCNAGRAKRLLASARAVGLVTEVGDMAFRPSLRLGSWYTALLPQRLAAAAGGVLSGLRSDTTISAYLTALVGARSTTLAESLATGELRTASWLGRSFPLSGSAGAPALISAFTDEVVMEVFAYTTRPKARGLPRSLDEYLAVVNELRRNGSVLISEYGENGLASVTAPVCGLAGEVAGALCLVGPPDEVQADVHRLRQDAMTAAIAIGRRLAADDV